MTAPDRRLLVPDHALSLVPPGARMWSPDLSTFTTAPAPDGWLLDLTAPDRGPDGVPVRFDAVRGFDLVVSPK